MFKESLQTFLANNVGFIASVLTSIIINRSLGPTVAGTYYLLSVTYVLIVNITNLGFNISNSTLASEDKAKVSAIHTHSLILSCVIGFLTIFSYLIFSPILNDLVFKGIDKNLLVLSLINVPFSLYSTYWGAIMVGLHEIKTINIFGIFSSFSTAFVIFITLVVLKMGIKELLIASLLSTTLLNVLMFFILLKKKGSLSYPSMAVFKESFDLGFKGHLGNIAHYIFLRFDSYVVNAFFGTRQVGYYGLATSLAEKIWMVVQPVYTVIFSEVTSQNSQTAALLVSRIVRIVVVGLIGVSLFVAIFGQFIIKILYGDAFLPAYPALLALLPGVIFFAASWFMSLYIISNLKRPMITTSIAWAALAVSLLFYLYLIPRLGIIGAGISSSVTYCFVFLATLTYFIKLAKIPVNSVLLINKEDINYLLSKIKVFTTKLAR